MSRQKTRTERILSILEQKHVINLRDIAALLGCSLSTARRDLAALAPLGQVQLTRGGAVWRDHLGGRPSSTGLTLTGEKQRIGRAAAELIRDGDAVAIGGGTTACALIRALRGRHVSVVTNALDVALEALPLSGPRVVLLAGELLATREIVGPLAEETLARLHIDTVFMSVNGISTEHGATVMSHLDARVLQAMAAAARRIVVLADHTKIGHAALTNIVPTSAIHTLITDAAEPVPSLAAIRAAGVQVIEA